MHTYKLCMYIHMYIHARKHCVYMHTGEHTHINTHARAAHCMRATLMDKLLCTALTFLAAKNSTGLIGSKYLTNSWQVLARRRADTHEGLWPAGKPP